MDGPVVVVFTVMVPTFRHFVPHALCFRFDVRTGEKDGARLPVTKDIEGLQTFKQILFAGRAGRSPDTYGKNEGLTRRLRAINKDDRICVFFLNLIFDCRPNVFLSLMVRAGNARCQASELNTDIRHYRANGWDWWLFAPVWLKWWEFATLQQPQCPSGNVATQQPASWLLRRANLQFF